MRKLIAFIFLSLFFVSLNAEILIDDKLNYALDLPEGFEIEAADTENRAYFFSHPDINVKLVLKVYEQKSADAVTVLGAALEKLGAKSELASEKWLGNTCSLAYFTMTLDNTKYAGRAICSPLEQKDFYVTVIAYCPENIFSVCQQFMVSALNSLSVSDKGFESEGIFMVFAFPKTGDKNINLSIDGKTIKTTIDKSDEEASKFMVDLEFSVLALYQNHPLWKEAWQRYYRLVFRDNYARLQKVSDDISKTLYPICKKEKPENPETAYLTKLLSWTQNFSYERDTKNKTSADFTSPVEAIAGKGNDCDSRSMLLCCIMQRLGVDSILLISREYSHAMCAFNIDAPGQKFETSRGSYIMCETTTKVTPGTIAAEHADMTKWIVVE